MPTLTIVFRPAPFQAALAELLELAKSRGELVQAFLGGIDCAAQLCRLDLDGLPAAGAGELWIALEPSDLLVEFLAASRAGESDGL